jgi:hypothetical protein
MASQRPSSRDELPTPAERPAPNQTLSYSTAPPGRTTANTVQGIVSLVLSLVAAGFFLVGRVIVHFTGRPTGNSQAKLPVVAALFATVACVACAWGFGIAGARGWGRRTFAVLGIAIATAVLVGLAWTK